jgi:hypothetical protein
MQGALLPWGHGVSWFYVCCPENLRRRFCNAGAWGDFVTAAGIGRGLSGPGIFPGNFSRFLKSSAFICPSLQTGYNEVGFYVFNFPRKVAARPARIVYDLLIGRRKLSCGITLCCRGQAGTTSGTAPAGEFRGSGIFHNGFYLLGLVVRPGEWEELLYPDRFRR